MLLINPKIPIAEVMKNGRDDNNSDDDNSAFCLIIIYHHPLSDCLQYVFQ
jgi:hypothetical protein